MLRDLKEKATKLETGLCSIPHYHGRLAVLAFFLELQPPQFSAAAHRSSLSN
jgi:hypothetical protein